MPAANPTQPTAVRFACADPAAPARYFALVPCAGSGSRAGTAQPKQYQPIADQPLVMHTLWALAGVARLAGGLVVLTPGDDFAWPRGAQWPDLFMRQACGGATRAHSVCITKGWSAMGWYCLGWAVPARLPLPAQGTSAK